MRVFLFTNSFFVAGFQMLFLSSKCNRWVRVEVRTLLHDADNKRKKGRVQNENRANWNDERNGLRVANIWIVCVCVCLYEEIEIRQHSCNSSLALREIPRWLAPACGRC